MPAEAIVIADSISPDGARLTTMQVKMHRMILSEFNTHRVFSRNASSSRAIPVKTLMKRMIEDPAVPVKWGKNQKGMQASEFYTDEDIVGLEADWLELRDIVMEYVQRVFLDKWNLHKQIANRPLEAWMWTYDVVTATDWDNYMNLRCHPDAQPEINALACEMREALGQSTPTLKNEGEWHLPYVLEEDIAAGYDLQTLLKISAARCARVSYRTHDGLVPKPEADIGLHDGLLSSGHMSPLEHPATPFPRHSAPGQYCGNFRGWTQYRKTLPGEAVFTGGQEE